MFKTQQEKVRVTQIGHFYHTECWYHLPFAVYEKTESCLRRTNTKNHECGEERSRESSLRIPQKLPQKDTKVHCGDAIENQ